MDDTLIDAAERVLFATVGKKQQEYPFLIQLREFLNQYVLARPLIDGREIESLAEALGLSCEGPIGTNLRRRETIPPFVMHDAYQHAVMRAGGLLHAQVDREALYLIARRSWVPILAAMIAEGPELAGARAQAAIYAFSLTSVQANRRRATGRRAVSAVHSLSVEARRLFKLIHQLRALPVCERWTFVPEIELPSMPRGGYEVVAPRVELVRHALQELTGDIQARLGVSTIEDELAALDAMSDRQMLGSGLWLPMRDRLLLMLMLLTGGRRAAITRLRRKDYIRDYVGPPPDHQEGAALDLRPQKGKHRDEIRRKPIPTQTALVIESYMRLQDRWAAARGESSLPMSASLLVAQPGRQHSQPEWIHRRVAGMIGKQRPLVPRHPSHLPEHIVAEEAAYCGYTPHEFRHFANQLAEGAGRIYNERHPATGGDVNPPIPYYAAALLDNGGVENDMRALYGDRRAPAMQEVIAGRAIAIGWEILTTRVGQRKRPNLDAYTHELICLHRIEDEEKRLERAARTLQAKRSRTGAPTLPQGDVTEGDRLEAVLRRQEMLIALVEELKEELLDSAAITHQAVQLSRQKADTITKLNMYRLDRATWLSVPDTAPPGAEKVDWDAIDSGTLGKPLMPGTAGTPVRDWLTVGEFCEIAEITARSTVTRWIKGEHLPTRRDRRPWAPDDVPVDESLGVNYRRIWVPCVNELFWRTRLRREALAQTLSRWPREQGWTTKDGQPTPRCLEPIRTSTPRLQIAA